MGKTDTRQRTTWGTRFRILVRFIGITGVLAAAVGGMLLDSVLPIANWTRDSLRVAGSGIDGQFAQVAAWTLASGIAAVSLSCVIELLGGLALVTGRRMVASTSATIGTLAAVALLVMVNYYSFTHHARQDLTRDRRYSLPPDLIERFQKLRNEAPTTIVVLQMHKTFGTLTDKRDSYTSEAERLVAEKVKDSVDLFRELGPRFNVVVFDTEAFGYNRALDDLTKDAPELKTAIESAPENSIFFHAHKRVQRLSFNDFLQLDKTASKEAEEGRGNLVLLPQGIETFAQRILAVQERRPKAAVCIVHPALGTDVDVGRESYGTAGLKKTMEDHGFDVIDIVLKKNWEDESKEIEPSAQTARESQLELAEADFDAATDKWRIIRDNGQVLDRIRAELQRGQILSPLFYDQLRAAAREAQWLEMIAAFRKFDSPGRRLSPESEPELRAMLIVAIDAEKTREGEQLAEANKERAAAEAKVKAALADERSVEDRRVPDVKSKLERLLADVDLLILPRMTLINATTPVGIPPSIHTISADQTEAIKKFMKAGKPVLACLGPISASRGPQLDAIDGFEKLLAERGIELGKETILYDSEQRAFAARRSGAQLGGAGMSEIPPLTVLDRTSTAEGKAPNPIGAALRLSGRAVEQKLDLRFRALRPVYLAEGWQEKMPFVAEFVLTGSDSWNEEKPFALGDQRGHIVYLPRFDPTLMTDSDRKPRSAERRGPFPVGVAIESKVPADWMQDDLTAKETVASFLNPFNGVMSALVAVEEQRLDRPTERLVVFGSGGLFTGTKLEPSQEKLLLHTVNWLTNRTDRLPRDTHNAWSYPRVAMTDQEHTLWQLGTAIGLPLVAVYAGLLALMLRRMR